MGFAGSPVIDTLTGASWDSTNNTLDPFNAARDTAPIPNSGSGISTPSAGGYAFEFWRNVAPYGPDVECFVSFPTVGAGFLVRVIARLTDPSTSSVTGDCYMVQGAPGGTATVYRIINTAADGTIGSYTMNASAAGLGLRVTGSGATVTLEVWEYVSGAWSLGTSLTDTHANRITTWGYIGMLGADTAGASRWTNFGGRTIRPISPEPAGARAIRGLYTR